MDQDALVIFKLDGGRRLVDALLTHGLDIRAAFWAKPSEEGWRLFLVSPLVEDPNARFPYHLVREVLQNVPEWGIDGSDVRAVGVSDSMAQAATEFVANMTPRATPFGGAVLYKNLRLGRQPIDGAYIYPLAKPAPAGST